MAAPGVSPSLVNAIAAHFRTLGYRQHGDWLNGPCIYPERHAHEDRRGSFGFNVRTGYGNCFRCGSMLARDIAARLEINPYQQRRETHEQDTAA